MTSIQFRFAGALVICSAIGSLAAQPLPANKPTTHEEAEAKKRVDEAEQKRLKEIEERELAAKLAAEEAARQKAENEKSFLTKLLENSKLYTGFSGGLGLGLNKIHGAGYTLSMMIDYLAYKTYGLHFAAVTGQYPAVSSTLSSGNAPITISSGGSFGILNFDFAAVYALPAVMHIEPAVGLGVSVYQLRAGALDFNRTVAPLIYGSLYYNLLSHLQVGFITQLVFASASKLQDTGREFVLDSSAGLTTLTLQLSLRYSWF